MRFIFLLFVLLASEAVFAGNENFSTQLTGALDDGSKYTVLIKEVPYTPIKGEEPDDGSMWGIDGGYPRTIVETFKIIINSKPIHVPKKSYRDICNIHDAAIKEENGKVLLLIKGGDAAGSFRATYTIQNGWLVERLIRMGEFPDEVWEKTTYHNEIWNNENM